MGRYGYGDTRGSEAPAGGGSGLTSPVTPGEAVRTLGPVQQIAITPIGTVQGHIVPSVDSVFDVGSPTNRYEDLYVVTARADNYQSPVKISGAVPEVRLIETDQAANSQRWEILVADKIMHFRVANDDGSSPVSALQLVRGTGPAITAVRSASHFDFALDNTYDVGTSGNRPRTIWAATSFKVQTDGRIDEYTAVSKTHTRYGRDDDDGTVRLVGGSNDATGNASWITVVGCNYIAGDRGIIQIVAGNPGTPTGADGTIQFYTGATLQRVTIDRDGLLYVEKNFQVASTASTRYFTVDTTGRGMHRFDDNAIVTPLDLQNRDFSATTHGVQLVFSGGIGGVGPANITAGALRCVPETGWTSTTTTQDSAVQILNAVDGAVGIAASFGGVIQFRRHIEFDLDNTYRIGNTASTRPQAIHIASSLHIGGSQTLVSRRTGWGQPTGTATRSTFATGTVTLVQLAERVKALIDDCFTHGIIGN